MTRCRVLLHSDIITGQTTDTDHGATFSPQPTAEDQKCGDHTHRQRKPQYEVSHLSKSLSNISDVTMFFSLEFIEN